MSSRLPNPSRAQVLEARRAAHRMSRRGRSATQIAEHLGITPRQVFRYLQDPPPPDAPEEPSVDLASFYMRGACFGRYDIEWATTENPAQIEAAKAVCGTCPVMQRCRAYGVSQGLADSGIWGGLTQSERRRRAAAAAQRTVVA